jgi:glutaredoxin
MNLHRLSMPWRRALRRTPWVALLTLSAAGSALAQYKVVGPDGKVTYTDRPPTSNEGKATPLSSRGGSAAPAPDASLPIELRQAASRYPVTLYTVASACELCSAARQLLRQRGIPYAEKQVQSPEDTDALERLSGGRDIPTLSIGSQTLRGLASDVWVSYLDAAGYPRESRLPANYQYAAPTPIAERAPARSARAADPAAPAAPVASTPAPAPDNPTGIKF